MWHADDITQTLKKVLNCAMGSPKKKRLHSVSSFLLKYFVVNFGFIVHEDNSFKLLEYLYVYVLVLSSFSAGHLRVVGDILSNILFCSTMLTVSIHITTAK